MGPWSKATAKMLTQYTPPWKVEEEKMAMMRSLKASGQWPAPPPVPQVLACTTRSRTRPRDLQDVLDLDSFQVPGEAGGG